jgi:ketosteroid isomerase-like protein
MSSESVDVARKGIEAWNRRDAELWLSYAAPQITWIPGGPAAVDRAVYRGREEVASVFAAAWQTWDVFRFQESEVRDLGDAVLWLGHVHMRGSVSHVELDQQFAAYSQLSDGKVIRIQTFSAGQAGSKPPGCCGSRR